MDQALFLVDNNKSNSVSFNVIKSSNNDNSHTTAEMISSLEASRISIDSTMNTIKEIERLNKVKVDSIQESGKNSIIQVNDRISFIIELEEIFKYLKEKLNEENKKDSSDENGKYAEVPGPGTNLDENWKDFLRYIHSINPSCEFVKTIYRPGSELEEYPIDLEEKD